jgi:REP element-mobilizing transposase RayT
MKFFMQLFKPHNEKSRFNDEFQRRFEDNRIITINTIKNANIIGDTLYVARDKVKLLDICPYKIDGKKIIPLQSYNSNRCFVEINKNIITKIKFFG